MVLRDRSSASGEGPSGQPPFVKGVRRYGEADFSPELSVITPNLNGRGVLPAFLDSLAASSAASFELVLVDNGSTDGSVGLLDETKLGRVNALVVSLDRNLGFAGASNIGVTHSRGRILVFLNNDTTIEPDCLAKMAGALGDRSVGAVQAKLLTGDGRLIDGGGDFIDVLGVPFNLARGERAAGRLTREREIFSARAAAMAMERGLYERLGGFDRWFFAAYEDVDLGWRTRGLGYRILLLPTAVVYHKGSLTSKNMTRGQELANRNLIALVAKNMEFPLLLLSIAVASGQYYLSLLSAALGGGGRGLTPQQLAGPMVALGHGLRRRNAPGAVRGGVRRADLVYRGSVTAHNAAALLFWVLKYRRSGFSSAAYKEVTQRWVSTKFSRRAG